MDLTTLITSAKGAVSPLVSALPDWSAVAQYLPITLNVTGVPYGILAVYILWVFYLALTNLMRAKEAGKLTKPAYALGIPLLVVGYALDVLCNIIIMTIVFVEIPKEWTVTARLTRHSKGSDWRAKASGFICSNFLDVFDPSGCHCGDAPAPAAPTDSAPAVK